MLCRKDVQRGPHPLPHSWSLHCPICKLQSRLSGSSGEIRALWSSVSPRAGTEAGPDCLAPRGWGQGNLFFFWELLKEHSDLQLRKRGKKKRGGNAPSQPAESIRAEREARHCTSCAPWAGKEALVGLILGATNPPSERSPQIEDLCLVKELDAEGLLCRCPT